jgi:hypothetical protein
MDFGDGKALQTFIGAMPRPSGEERDATRLPAEAIGIEKHLKCIRISYSVMESDVCIAFLARFHSLKKIILPMDSWIFHCLPIDSLRRWPKGDDNGLGVELRQKLDKAAKDRSIEPEIHRHSIEVRIVDSF